jgi:hypothetical protein
LSPLASAAPELFGARSSLLAPVTSTPQGNEKAHAIGERNVLFPEKDASIKLAAGQRLSYQADSSNPSYHPERGEVYGYSAAINI